MKFAGQVAAFSGRGCGVADRSKSRTTRQSSSLTTISFLILHLHRAGSASLPSTASFVAAALQPPAGLYILYHATNNKELADAYGQLQSKYQPETTSSYKAGEPVHARWDIRGFGLNHTTDAEITTEPEESPITTDKGLFCYETDSGQQLQLTY